MLHDLKFDGSSLHCDDPCKTADLAVAAVDVGVAAVAASCLSMDSQPERCQVVFSQLEKE